MENIGRAYFADAGFAARKKRSCGSRRPCSDTQKFLQTYTLLSPSTQLSGLDEEGCYFGERTAGSDGLRSENKLKKLKLKFGGVTHTLHPKSTAENASSGGSSISKSSQCFDAYRPRVKLVIQDSSFGKGNSLGRKKSCGSVNENETFNEELVRMSKWVPKRRVVDVELNEFGGDDADEEIHCLGRPKGSRERKRRISIVSDGCQMDGGVHVGLENYVSLKLGKDGSKKLRSENRGEDEDYVQEEESISDDESEYKSRKHRISGERSEAMHNLALRTHKDAFLGGNTSPLEFPNGLPCPLPKKHKVKRSELEQQLKKAEAAQKRRMQSEKAAKEAEAEAIRKIRGQDSGRKKKEQKTKKQRDVLAQMFGKQMSILCFLCGSVPCFLIATDQFCLVQEKAAGTDTLGSNTVRWVIGPSGTTVIFSDDIGLPNIFNSVPCSYPPPREKCAGPNCTNAYKYRDSKSKLPLCSLLCYKAIHGKMRPSITC